MRYDLNLLKTFDCLYTERSVSRAATRMHLSQPAMSAHLAKLRELFQDPLFTRDRYGISPTEKAQRIHPSIQHALQGLDTLILTEQTFDPRNATNTFIIAANDYFESLILPKVVAQLLQEAPHVHIQVFALNQHISESGLMSGEAHIAFGRISTPPENIVLQEVMKDGFVCLGARSWWQKTEALTQEQYQDSDHVVVRPPGKLSTGVFKVLETLDIERHIKYQVTHFHYLAAVLRHAPLLATVPARIGVALTENTDCHLMAPPADLGTFPFQLAWHQRYQKDPAHLWFRELIKRCCKELDEH